MRFRVEVICVNDEGGEQRRDVMQMERRELAMETLGLSLAEGKAILEGVQDFVASQQISEDLKRRRVCPICGARHHSQAAGTSTVETVFGPVAVPNPQWECCPCQPEGPKIFRPTAIWLKGRTSPERLYLETKWGSLIHFNVTEHPTALWTGQPMVEAFPEDTAPHCLLRDRDKIYRRDFRERTRSLSIEEVLSAPASPWQRAYVERLIGSIRRDCLDHVVIVGERHLRTILKSYLEYYHRSRTHLALAEDTPEPRAVQPPELGAVVGLPEVGGLPHRYERRAAYAFHPVQPASHSLVGSCAH